MKPRESIASGTFAYGSNMLVGQMKERAPSATVVGVGVLDRFVLRWHKRSKDGSGKCSIEETGRPEDHVWGVVFRIDPTDKARLDAAEGLGHGYGERTVPILMQGSLVDVSAYYATSIDPHVKPYDWYRQLVVAGARAHGFPIEYIRMLEAVPVIKDIDEKRAASRLRALEPKSVEPSPSGKPQELLWMNEHNRLTALYAAESDRAVALLAASFLDEQLKDALKRVLVDDETVIERLFGDSSSLGTFNARIDLAFAMGHLTKPVYRELHLIRKIRNHFAHYADQTDFRTQSVQDQCRALALPASFLEDRAATLDARTLFLYATSHCVGHIRFGMQHVRQPVVPDT